MDNYFTSVPLFKKLRICEYGAIGTTRPHAEFPDGLKEIRKRFSTKLEWNTLLAKVSVSQDQFMHIVLKVFQRPTVLHSLADKILASGPCAQSGGDLDGSYSKGVLIGPKRYSVCP